MATLLGYQRTRYFTDRTVADIKFRDTLRRLIFHSDHKTDYSPTKSTVCSPFIRLSLECIVRPMRRPLKVLLILCISFTTKKGSQDNNGPMTRTFALAIAWTRRLEEFGCARRAAHFFRLKASGLGSPMTSHSVSIRMFFAALVSRSHVAPQRPRVMGSL